MKKICVFLAVCLGASLLAVPASALFLRSRNGQGVAFRDLVVCTDGIQFELLEFDNPDITNSGRPTPITNGGLNSEVLNEGVYISTQPYDGDPIQDGAGPDANTVVVDDFDLTSVSNEGLTLSLQDGTTRDTDWTGARYFWKATPTVEFSRDLAAGTTLFAYVLLGGEVSDDRSENTDTFVVSDCTLFDDPTPPPPTGNPCDHPDAIHGTDGNDKIRGTNGDDIICAGDGNDRIFSYGGNDIIYAGDGNDKVHAGSGDDIVFGEGGNDNILGQWGNDTLDGGPGNDKLHGSSGDDVLIGGPGNDRLLGGKGHDTLTQ